MQTTHYSYSRPSATAVADRVTANYELPGKLHCQYFVSGLHDNYLIESDHARYILRIYRADWRSDEEVAFELQWLDLLGRVNAPVASPIITNKGQTFFHIDSVEARRAAALFNYAEGSAPGNRLTVTESTLLGKTVARTHALSDGLALSHSRQLLDIPYLLDRSLEVIAPYVDTRMKDYLFTLQTRLKQELPELPQTSPVYGLCIGDVNGSNFHINEQQQITLFDFDQCGYGHRAFEIGKFCSSVHGLEHKADIKRAFLEAYQQERKLSTEELRAIPYYEIVSVIWVMAIHVDNVDYIGRKLLSQAFWDRKQTSLREMERAL